MTKVVQHGTGKNAFRQGFLIAGKTGTAQISKKGQGYLEGLFSASFLGFFPATNPRIVGLILFDQPGGTIHSGGGIAAPVFREVVENIIPIIEYGETAHTYNLKEISLKDEKEKLDPSHVPDLKGKTMKEVIAILKNYNNIKYKTYGNGVCSKQEPKSGEALKNGDVWNIYFEE
jgi:cell division protein FtsI (penicillin-binding protein 3)